MRCENSQEKSGFKCPAVIFLTALFQVETWPLWPSWTLTNLTLQSEVWVCGRGCKNLLAGCGQSLGTFTEKALLQLGVSPSPELCVDIADVGESLSLFSYLMSPLFSEGIFFCGPSEKKQKNNNKSLPHNLYLVTLTSSLQSSVMKPLLKTTEFISNVLS